MGFNIEKFISVTLQSFDITFITPKLTKMTDYRDLLNATLIFSERLSHVMHECSCTKTASPDSSSLNRKVVW